MLEYFCPRKICFRGTIVFIFDIRMAASFFTGKIPNFQVRIFKKLEYTCDSLMESFVKPIDKRRYKIHLDFASVKDFNVFI